MVKRRIFISDSESSVQFFLDLCISYPRYLADAIAFTHNIIPYLDGWFVEESHLFGK
jgi:hypothetical protein